MTQKAKTQKVQICVFVQNRKKRNGNICVLYRNFWTNHNLDQISTTKWPSEPQFCERWTYIWRKMARNYWFMRNIHFESVFSSKMSTFAHFHPHLLNNKNIKTLFPKINLNPLFSKDILNPIFACKKCFIKLNLFFTLFF